MPSYRRNRVRKGVTYRWIGWSPYNPSLKDGELVRVVNIPGGTRGGVFRNVEDEKGRVHFVHTGNLAPRHRTA